MGRAALPTEGEPRIGLWLEAENEVRELRSDEAGRVFERYRALLREHRKLAGMTGKPGGQLIVIEQRLVAEITGWLE